MLWNNSLSTVSTENYDVIEDAGVTQLKVFLSSSDDNVGVEEAFTVDVTVNSSGITFPATDGSDYNATTTTVSFPAKTVTLTTSAKVINTVFIVFMFFIFKCYWLMMVSTSFEL